MALLCPFVARDCTTACQGYKENRLGEGYCGVVASLANLAGLVRVGKDVLELVICNSKGDRRRG